MANDQCGKLVKDLNNDSANMNDEHKRDDIVNALVREPSRNCRQRGYRRKLRVFNIDSNKSAVTSASSKSSTNMSMRKKRKVEEIPCKPDDSKPRPAEATNPDPPSQLTLDGNNVAGDVRTQDTTSQGAEQPCYLAEEIQGWAQFIIDNLS